MRGIGCSPAVLALAPCLAMALPAPVRAGPMVTLDVPQLGTAGSAPSFHFLSLQFNVYLVGIGDAITDYSANVLANDHENYTYLATVSSGSGRGAGYHPPTHITTAASTYSDTYTNVTTPPGLLDAFFHFSGADAAGLPLNVAVADTGHYTLTLTADADLAHTPIVPGTPLSNQPYTLEYQTDSLAGSQVSFTSTVVPEPLSLQLLGAGVVCLLTMRRRHSTAR